MFNKKAYDKQWKRDNPDRHSFNNVQSRKRLGNVAVKEWRRKNREKYLAHKAVENAIARGVLVRSHVCSICDSTGRIEGHHPNYKRQLQVIWVCPECHKDFHRP